MMTTTNDVAIPIAGPGPTATVWAFVRWRIRHRGARRLWAGRGRAGRGMTLHSKVVFSGVVVGGVRGWVVWGGI